MNRLGDQDPSSYVQKQLGDQDPSSYVQKQLGDQDPSSYVQKQLEILKNMNFERDERTVLGAKTKLGTDGRERVYFKKVSYGGRFWRALSGRESEIQAEKVAELIEKFLKSDEVKNNINSPSVYDLEEKITAFKTKYLGSKHKREGGIFADSTKVAFNNLQNEKNELLRSVLEKERNKIPENSGNKDNDTSKTTPSPRGGLVQQMERGAKDMRKQAEAANKKILEAPTPSPKLKSGPTLKDYENFNQLAHDIDYMKAEIDNQSFEMETIQKRKKKNDRNKVFESDALMTTTANKGPSLKKVVKEISQLIKSLDQIKQDIEKKTDRYQGKKYEAKAKLFSKFQQNQKALSDEIEKFQRKLDDINIKELNSKERKKLNKLKKTLEASSTTILNKLKKTPEASSTTILNKL